MAVKLGDICNLMTGGTPSRSHKEYFQGGNIKWLVSGDIHKGEIHDCDGRITEEALKNSNARILPVNSVMIALNGQGKTRATVAILRTEATCNQSLVSIIPKDQSKVLPEWIYWNLKGRYHELRKITGDSGNDRRGLNMIIIRNIDLPTPPSISEQRRVVAKLDAAFKQIDRITDLTQMEYSNFRNMFKKVTNEQIISSQNYAALPLGSVCDFVRGPFGGSLKKDTFKKSGYAVYEQRHAIYGDFTNIRYFVDKEKFDEMQRFQVRPFDLIMSCSGTIGRIAVIPPGVKDGIINQALLKFSPIGHKLNGLYLKHWIESSVFQEMLAVNTGGAAIQNVASVKVLKGLPISLPPLTIQEAVVEKVNSLKGKEAAILEFMERKLLKIGELKQSMLHQAFMEVM